MRALTILLLLLAPAAQAAESLAGHLDRALAIDPNWRSLQAQRNAVAARRAMVNTPIAGSPVLSGSLRSDTRGPRESRDMEVEFGAPLWLPGQRSALGGTVTSSVAEIDRRLQLRRLEVAGLLREAWWQAALAEREARLARDRVATARDIARDVRRRADLGDIPPSDALLAQNETLAAELELAQAEAELVAARAAYATLTGGAMPNLRPERVEAPPPLHPALATARAALEVAESQARLVAATPRDNPELSVFGRGEYGTLTEQGVSLGLRLRFPLATEARNAPRRAEAEAGITRATAQLAGAQRLVEAQVAAARAALRAAEENVRLARQRLGVADRQLEAARRAFRSGETGLFDLYRVRQLQLEAAGAEARAAVAAGRARSRLNQAIGAIPGE